MVIVPFQTQFIKHQKTAKAMPKSIIKSSIIAGTSKPVNTVNTIKHYKR